MRNDVARELKERQATIESAIAPQRLAEVLLLVENGEVSSGAARELLREIWTTDESAAAAMARLGLAQVRDETQLVAWVQEVLEKSPSQVAQVREGRTQVLGFLVGQVMKRSAGRAEPRRVQELVKAALGVEEDPAS